MWIRVHPEAALATRPHLFAAVSEYRAGLGDPGRAEWESCSAVHFEARLHLASAHNRALARPKES